MELDSSKKNNLHHYMKER